jgi:hypothetical protein
MQWGGGGNRQTVKKDREHIVGKSAKGTVSRELRPLLISAEMLSSIRKLTKTVNVIEIKGLNFFCHNW